MRRVLARWQRSGLTLREFGQQRGIPLSTLTWWRQVFRRAGEPVNAAAKSFAGGGAVFTVVTSKYADHLPLYRQEQIFERHGVEVTRRTLSEWNGAVADMLEPIVRAMHREQVCQSPWIQCDDTTLDVQDPSRAPEIRAGHLWAYRGEVVYDFT